jgi:hypothetical protein
LMELENMFLTIIVITLENLKKGYFMEKEKYRIKMEIIIKDLLSMERKMAMETIIIKTEINITDSFIEIGDKEEEK